jgi:nickel-dependent lactate racemase
MINNSNWKKIEIEYLNKYLTLEVPTNCEILQMKPIPYLQNMPEAIEQAFENPVQGKTIEEIVSSHNKSADELTASIAVSDNTRPVPYNCTNKENILSPILYRLERSGIKKQNIKIIIGTGTHAATSLDWKSRTFGEEVCRLYQLEDHDCYAQDLISIGKVKGVPVKINRNFFQADIHIVTGLVETHFMAGASGGRKAICPGMVNLGATQVFHGPQFMDNIHSGNLNFKDNPCHEFALEVARRSRVDFTVNVLLDGEMRICGIYTGELEGSHQKAVEYLRFFSEINIDKEYDIVLTHGGKGAVNHYQAVKGVWAALPVVKEGGHIILIAHNEDREPIGSQHYKDLLEKFKEVGVGNFSPMLIQPEWNFTHDQWEVQKWEQIFIRLGGLEYLIYCTTNIEPGLLNKLPGVSGYRFIQEYPCDIATMTQQAIYHYIRTKKNPTMAFIKEGPYLVLRNLLKHYKNS